ncbi:hypothetical protein [Chryseolinea sp. H1M3-3]|uniref:hypothetical protein n=1 Tax=Chryseolinea sp. H1M3-3 TaxID=3034144 RepID=UPI0023EC902E|nr:hypothetical protein [Chryseolinea sp. H1M3-3]
MKEKKPSDIVPDQHTGKAIDAESTVDLPSEEDAKAFFKTVKSRLQNVNEWKSYAGNLSAVFQLVDPQGTEVQRDVQKGDYFKIDIPGPGTKSGEGYDWVQVEDVENDNTPNGDRFAFRVRPTDNPQSNENDVAHFYSDQSTSSFVVERNGNTITASIHDRNTKPNTSAERTSDKIRDAVVGAAGVASFSKIQWKKLTDGLLKTS